MSHQSHQHRPAQATPPTAAMGGGGGGGGGGSNTPSSLSTSSSTNPSSQAAAAAQSSSSSSLDRFQKHWPTLINYMICACQKAEKIVMDDAAVAAGDPNNNNNAARTQHYKEMDEFAVAFLRARVNWGRLITYLEAKLEGKAQEMETNQQYFRSMPKLGLQRRQAQQQQRTLSETAATDSNDATIAGKRKRDPEDADADNSTSDIAITGPTRPPQPAAAAVPVVLAPDGASTTTTTTTETSNPSLAVLPE